ncbi:MAG: FAD-binding protein, partial [Ignavibacteriales bacterium]|nr:FAD-binding protein [Ignavibacteriales bacterium]
CDAVVFPENEADVVEALKRANERGERVTVAGAGTAVFFLPAEMNCSITICAVASCIATRSGFISA